MFLTKDSKSPYYQLVYFINGKRTKISTRTKDKLAAERFLVNFNQGKPKIKVEEKSSITLNEFAAKYKEYVKRLYSQKYYEGAVVPSFKKLQCFLHDKDLNLISSREVDDFISTIYSSAKFAASLYYRTLKAAFNKAVVWEYIQSNPFEKIKSPKVAKSYPLFLSEAELILIINSTDKQLFKDIFITAFYTGMRLNEILSMTWQWIDLQTDVITVRNSQNFQTKNKKERIIPLHTRVKEVFVKRYCPDLKELVFHRAPGVKLNPGFVSKSFKKAIRKTNLNPEYHFHTLRHSFASNLVQRGVSLYTLKVLLGHGSVKTTEIYSHLQADNLTQAVNLL